MLDWFKNYLSNRTQRVALNGQFSDWGYIKAGVPQGSVLGPLLFLVYVNDIVDIIRSNIRLYADDVTLYITVDDPIDSTKSAETLNKDLKEIEKWSQQWLVQFNGAKTKTMLISNKRNPSYSQVSFQESALEYVTVHKHLGLLIRSDLSWSTHINFIVNKAKRLTGIMKLLQYKLSRRSLEIIYFSYVRPILEYGDVVWGGCTETEAGLLESVQLAAARAVTGATIRTSHDKLYSETGWEKLSKRRENHRLELLYKIVHGLTPKYLFDLLPQNVSSRTNYNFRSKANITEIKNRIMIFKNSFLPSTIRQWNTLTLATRNSEDVESFRRKLNKNVTKPNELFYIGNRTASILHARIRMGCSGLNQDLHKIGIKESPQCSCGSAKETAYHYFFECPNYIIQRDILQSKIIPLAPFTLNTLLFGNKSCSKANNKYIFEKTQTFITQSGRFKPP